MKKVIDTVTRRVTFTFDGLEPVTFDATKVSGENQTYATLHGFAARIGDNAALTKTAENNFTVTESMRREAVLELVNHYESGTTDWNTRVRQPRAAPLNPAILALAEKLGKTYEEAQAWFQAKLLAELA